MTKIGTLSNTIRAVLIVAVLTPAPLLAEPAATARQMLMLAQTRAQDHAVKNEVKKITERGPFPTRLPTPTSFASRDRELSTTSPVSASVAETKIEPTSPPMLSASRDDSNTVAPASTAEPEFDERQRLTGGCSRRRCDCGSNDVARYFCRSSSTGYAAHDYRTCDGQKRDPSSGRQHDAGQNGNQKRDWPS